MSKTLKIGVIALILTGIIGMGFVSAKRAAKGSNDFDTFYYAGQAVLQGKGVYYTGDYYEGDKTHAPFLYPPFAAIVFAPFALMPIRAAAFLWNLICVGLFAGSLVLCGRLLPSSMGIRLLDFTRLSTRCLTSEPPNFTPGVKRGIEPATIAALVFLLVLLIDNLTMAQVNPLVLVLTLASLWLIAENMPLRGGGLMAAAIAIKVTPLIFIPYFLLKRQWKALAGCFAGILLFFVLLPTLVLGGGQSVLLHRQWFGKTFKPALIGFYSRLRPEAQHPFKKSVEAWRTADLYNLLTPKNQSFSAVVTRWCLKDRKALAYSVPIHVAQRYPKLPVLSGGLSYDALKTAISLVQAGLLLFMFAVFSRRKGSSAVPRSLEFALLFLSMTLFSPLARSHQFIFWMLPVLFMGHAREIPRLERWTGVLHGMLYTAMGLYALQALPYGKAAGMGMGANFFLWMSWLFLLIQWTDANDLQGPKHKGEPVTP